MTDQTLADKALLNAVNHYLNQSVAWQPIASKGSTNSLYNGQTKLQKLILRINACEDWAFGVSRESEAQILELIQGYAWAPKVIKNNWQGGWCLMSDHGTSVTEASCQAASPLLLKAVDQWQSIPSVVSGRFDYTRLFDSYRSSIQNTLTQSTLTDNLSLLDQLIVGFGNLPEVPLCLTHHDLHPGNLCGNESQITVLDWEYAGFGNPWFDAACLCTKFGIPIAAIGSLPAFQHLKQPTLTQGMTNAIWLIKVLETLWLAVRSSDDKNREGQ